MSADHLTRAYDEVVLAMIRMRASGKTWGAVAAAFGRSVGSVQRTCKAVQDADVAYCGKRVKEAY